MYLKVKYLDLVKAKMEIRFRLPRDQRCHSCSYYDKNNNRHGRCTLFEADTCAEASCGKYNYYKETQRKL